MGSSRLADSSGKERCDKRTELCDVLHKRHPFVNALEGVPQRLENRRLGLRLPKDILDGRDDIRCGFPVLIGKLGEGVFELSDDGTERVRVDVIRLVDSRA